MAVPPIPDNPSLHYLDTHAHHIQAWLQHALQAIGHPMWFPQEQQRNDDDHSESREHHMVMVATLREAVAQQDAAAHLLNQFHTTLAAWEVLLSRGDRSNHSCPHSDFHGDDTYSSLVIQSQRVCTMICQGIFALAASWMGHPDEEIPEGLTALGTLLSHAVCLEVERLGLHLTPRSEDALRESEQRFRSIVENSIEGIVLTDETGIMIEWNHGIEQMIGLPREDVLGKPAWDVLFQIIPEEHKTPETHARYKETLQHFFATGDAPWLGQMNEYKMRRANGEECYVQQRIFGIKTNRGVQMCSFMRDMTQRKRAEEAVRVSNERYERAIQAAGVGVWDWNLKTGEIYLSPYLKGMLGYTDEEIVNHIDTWFEHIYPDDRERVWGAANAHIARKTPTFEIEHRMIHRNGSILWFAVRGVVVYDAQGTPLRMAGTDTDITQRKHMEEALRKSEARYRAVVEDQTDLICRFLPNGTLTFVNDAYCRYFGKTEAELIGPHAPATPAALSPHPEKGRIEKYLILFRNKPVATTEHRVVAANGEVRWQQWTDRAIFDEQGDVAEFQSVGRDITERVLNEKILQLQRDLAIALSSTSSMMEVLRQVLDAALKIEGIDSGGIYLVDQASGDLNLVISRGVGPQFAEQARFYTSTSPCAQLVHKGKPFYVGRGEERNEERSIDTIRDMSYHEEGIKSFAIIPVLNEGQVVASLNLASHVHDKIFQTARQIFEIISAQIGGAIARVRAETALQESQGNLQTLFDTMDDCLFILDTNGYIMRVNPVVEQRLGYSARELLQLHALDIHVPAQRPTVANVLAALTTETSAVCSVPLVTKEGNEIQVETRFTRGRWSNQDVLFGISRDIGELQQTVEALQHTSGQLTLWVNELERRNRDITLLNEMGDFLQSCLTVNDVYMVAEQFAAQLFNNQNGGLYILTPSQNVVEAMATWGENAPKELVFATESCWALRRGRTHRVDEVEMGTRCNHVEPSITYHICVPMIAQGKILGVLHLRSEIEEPTEARERWVQLATMVTEHIAMALANLQLRERLRDQAIRDSLTGLFNRRYLDDALVREFSRAARRKSSVGVIMLDIDHFKQFNTNYGHDAGDAMLSAVGMFLQTHVRGEDIACRYGGEEFTLILPDASLADTCRRAEELLESVRQLQVQHSGKSLGFITLSLGVANFPEYGTTVDEVIHAADTALLQAKEQGRNRVIIAERGQLNG